MQFLFNFQTETNHNLPSGATATMLFLEPFVSGLFLHSMSLHKKAFGDVLKIVITNYVHVSCLLAMTW